MNTKARSESSLPAGTPGGGDHAVEPAIEWVDGRRRTWRIELPPGLVVFRSGADTVALPADRWARDILVTPHGRGYIIRIETFDLSLGFVISDEQAKPLMTHIGAQRVVGGPVDDEADEAVRSDPLQWPRVSSLAVWALISSALVFVPVLGLLPAVATVVLLILHRKKVRRARALAHSRTVCTAAFVFLIAGLVVSTLATWGFARNLGGVSYAEDIQEESLAAPSHQADPAAADPPAATGSVSESGRNWGLLAAGLFVVIFSLSVHEAAHAVTAWWLGDDFARRLGRVTLKPTAHIDPFGTILLPLILFWMNVGVFGWAKPVPVRTECLGRPRRDHIYVSLAGPGSNLLLAAASLLLLLGLGCAVGIATEGAEVRNFSQPAFTATVTASGFFLAPVFAAACTILQLSFFINVLLAFFNLIPVPPLDGSWVLEHLFPNTLGRLYARLRPYGFLVFLGLLYSDVLWYLLLPAFVVIKRGYLLLYACTPF